MLKRLRMARSLKPQQQIRSRRHLCIMWWFHFDECCSKISLARPRRRELIENPPSGFHTASLYDDNARRRLRLFLSACGQSCGGCSRKETYKSKSLFEGFSSAEIRIRAAADGEWVDLNKSHRNWLNCQSWNIPWSKNCERHNFCIVVVELL